MMMKNLKLLWNGQVRICSLIVPQYINTGTNTITRQKFVRYREKKDQLGAPSTPTPEPLQNHQNHKFWRVVDPQGNSHLLSIRGTIKIEDKITIMTMQQISCCFFHISEFFLPLCFPYSEQNHEHATGYGLHGRYCKPCMYRTRPIQYICILYCCNASHVRLFVLFLLAKTLVGVTCRKLIVPTLQLIHGPWSNQYLTDNFCRFHDNPCFVQETQLNQTTPFVLLLFFRAPHQFWPKNLNLQSTNTVFHCLGYRWILLSCTVCM